MAFCKVCDREVGVEEKSRSGLIIGFIILGLVVPIWFITLPIFWGLALLMFFLPKKKHCGICKASLS